MILQPHETERFYRIWFAMLSDQSEHARVYGILGLVSPIEDVIRGPLPILARMTLLPFEGRITYDGLMAPYNVYFGSGIRGNLNDIYRLANERGAIITSLEAPALASPQQSRAEIAKRNDKLITAFRRDLAQSSLSMKMITQHAENIETFGRSYLLSQAPVRGLIDLTSADISAYLAQAQMPQAAR